MFGTLTDRRFPVHDLLGAAGCITARARAAAQPLFPVARSLDSDFHGLFYFITGTRFRSVIASLVFCRSFSKRKT